MILYTHQVKKTILQVLIPNHYRKLSSKQYSNNFLAFKIIRVFMFNLTVQYLKHNRISRIELQGDRSITLQSSCHQKISFDTCAICNLYKGIVADVYFLTHYSLHCNALMVSIQWQGDDTRRCLCRLGSRIGTICEGRHIQRFPQQAIRGSQDSPRHFQIQCFGLSKAY